jgi:hypothetical protein
MWRGRKSFEADLFASYRAAGLQEGQETFSPMGATLIDQAATDIGKLPKKVAAALSALDDLMLDAIIWYHSVVMVFWNAQPASDQHFDRAMMALFMRVAQDAMVVRNLIQAGFDVQAKNILRSIEEHVDTIYLLCIQPSLCEDFVRADDEESINQFWWKHLRNARKTAHKALVEIVKEDAHLREFIEFRKSERALLSSAHHPSYIACTMPFMSLYGSNETRYLYGSPSEWSFRTGKLLFYILAEAALFTTLLNGDMKRLIREGRKDHPLEDFVRRGLQHLATMLMFLVKNWSCPLFGTSTQFEAWMQRIPKIEEAE